MSARKCPKCGLVSFATQGSCKRCNASTALPQYPAASKEPTPITVVYDEEPRKGFSPLKLLLIVLAIALPLWWYLQSSETSIAKERAADEETQKELRRDKRPCGPGGRCY